MLLFFVTLVDIVFAIKHLFIEMTTFAVLRCLEESEVITDFLLLKGSFITVRTYVNVCTG